MNRFNFPALHFTVSDAPEQGEQWNVAPDPPSVPAVLITYYPQK